MKIYVLGSSTFMKEMVAAKDELIALGLDGWIHPDYEALVRGEMPETYHLMFGTQHEHAQAKINNDYFKEHYANISVSDAVLVVNLEKNGQTNYIGGNALMEMGQAYVNDKKIFLTHDLPEASTYLDELIALQPICLHGDLKNILKYSD